MRFTGLLVLAIFFPALAHATPPALATYTISHDTIYPAETAESGLATTTTIDIAFSESVKASIKIISASGTLIKSLYTSSNVKNPGPKIWDGTKTGGTHVAAGSYTILISATSTAGLTMTDSSKTVTVAARDSTPPDTSSDPTDTTTATAPASSGAPPEYIPIPKLRIITGGTRTISSGADTAFTAVVYDGKGNKRDDAVVTWSFGDGMKRTGASVFHPYYDPGEYVVVVHATTSDGGDALVESIITVKDASIKIASVSARGIALTNNSPRTLDLSLWRLSAGGKEFKIPTDTQILANRTILFPSQVIEFPVTGSALLLYPSGEVAATYPSVAIAQPSAPQASFNNVQTVEQFINTKKNVQAHEETIGAPAAATELAAAGAALPVAKAADSPKTSGLFRSPWFLGLLGVVVLASGAFILL